MANKQLEQALIIKAVQKWVETIVIDLNLCPFAKREVVKNRVRYIVSEATTEEQLLTDLHDELTLLGRDDSIETTLLIHPHVLTDFYDYNQFLDYADGLLTQMDLEGIYQIASFHPNYQFHDTQPDDVENYTNKSPYPVLHLLREESLEQRIDGYPDVDKIPENNIALLEKLGQEKISELLEACHK